MKIIVASTPIFKFIETGVPGYAGLEQLAWLHAKGLAEKGHSVKLVAPDNSVCPGVEVVPVGPEKQVDERIAHDKVWKHYLETDCIIDHTWQKYSYLLKGEQNSPIKNVPILGWLHAPVNTMYAALPPNVEKPCFVCISKDQANHFEGLFSHEARVCHNGCDTEVYKPLGIPRTDRWLFLARFSTIKGPDLAIEIARKAGVGLDLIGDTSITNEPELFQKCRSMADGKQIRIIGSISRGETTYWYSQAKGMLHPNQRFREPFGLAPVESMLCGTPCLTWNFGAMRETVKQGTSGWLVRSVDEAVNIIKSGSVDRIDRNECRNWALQYSVEAMLNRVEELCKEAVETGGW